MIKTLATDGNNDLYLVDGRNLGVLSGAPALSQSIKQFGLLRTGEDSYNINNGVDYLGTVFSSPPDMDGARASLVRASLKHPDAMSVDSMAMSLDANNTLKWTARITSIYGTLTAGNAS